MGVYIEDPAVGRLVEDPEIGRLAAKFAAEDGRSMGDALRAVLRQEEMRRAARAAGIEAHPDAEERLRRIEAAVREWQASPELDTRHPDDILYDDDGLPK